MRYLTTKMVAGNLGKFYKYAQRLLVPTTKWPVGFAAAVPEPNLRLGGSPVRTGAARGSDGGASGCRSQSTPLLWRKDRHARGPAAPAAMRRPNDAIKAFGSPFALLGCMLVVRGRNCISGTRGLTTVVARRPFALLGPRGRSSIGARVQVLTNKRDR